MPDTWQILGKYLLSEWMGDYTFFFKKCIKGTQLSATGNAKQVIQAVILENPGALLIMAPLKAEDWIKGA